LMEILFLNENVFLACHLRHNCSFRINKNMRNCQR
jgi:hypothetical protein